MAKTLLGLAAKLERIEKNLPKKLNVVAQRVAAVVLTTAATNTPVDTGRAVSNWNIGLGAANTASRGSYAYGDYSKSQVQHKAALATVITVGKIKIKESTPNQAIHVSNNAISDGVIRSGYIQDINRGVSSNGIPLIRHNSKYNYGGFKEKAIAAGLAELREQALKFKV